PPLLAHASTDALAPLLGASLASAGDLAAGLAPPHCSGLALSRRSRRLGSSCTADAAVGSRLITLDELLHQALCLVVAVLDGRRLHEVRAWALQRAADAAVERQLGAAHGVDDDAGGVGRVVHLELELDVEGHVAEVAALPPDVG